MIKHNNLHWIWLGLLIIVLDQWTKQLVLQYVNHPIVIFPFLNFTLVYNYGVAFGFLNQTVGGYRWLLVGVAILMSIILLIWLSRCQSSEKFLSIGLICVLGGALSNMLDRLYLGYVIDFIDVYIKQWHWPSFNIADSAITIGVIILIFNLCFKKH